MQKHKSHHEEKHDFLPSFRAARTSVGDALLSTKGGDVGVEDSHLRLRSFLKLQLEITKMRAELW